MFHGVVITKKWVPTFTTETCDKFSGWVHADRCLVRRSELSLEASVDSHAWVMSLSSYRLVISCLLIQEMINSDIDKKRKLGFLLSIFMGALFYLIKRRKEHVTSDFERDNFIEKSKYLF